MWCQEDGTFTIYSTILFLNFNNIKKNYIPLESLLNSMYSERNSWDLADIFFCRREGTGLLMVLFLGSLTNNFGSESPFSISNMCSTWTYSLVKGTISQLSLKNSTVQATSTRSCAERHYCKYLLVTFVNLTIDFSTFHCFCELKSLVFQ